MKFIAAEESPFYLHFFNWYTRFAMRWHFKQVWLQQKYSPKPDRRTVYFLNHNSWWDGLIPLYLNENIFHQKARAMMEDRQMKQYPFFKRIGAFSVNMSDPRSALTSLRYAHDSLQRERASLFIYPEGKITAASDQPPEFKPGLSWLYKQTDDIDFVPIAIYTHTFRNAKPELYIAIGESVDHDKQLDKKELTNLFSADIQHLLRSVRGTAGYDDEGFRKEL